MDSLIYMQNLLVTDPGSLSDSLTLNAIQSIVSLLLFLASTHYGLSSIDTISACGLVLLDMPSANIAGLLDVLRQIEMRSRKATPQFTVIIASALNLLDFVVIGNSGIDKISKLSEIIEYLLEADYI